MPQHTLVLNLDKEEDELLKEMKPKGRYNIKLASKKAVEVSVANPKKIKQFQKDLNDFFSILEETTNRDGFRGHNKNYYKNKHYKNSTRNNHNNDVKHTKNGNQNKNKNECEWE